MAGKTGNHKAIEQFLAYQQSTTAQPLQMAQFAIELAKHIPADTIIFDEALTSSPAVTRYLPPAKPGKYFVTRGGYLGIVFPGAMGAIASQKYSNRFICKWLLQVQHHLEKVALASN